MNKLSLALTDFFESDQALFIRICDALPQTISRLRDGVVEWINDAGWKRDGASCREEVIGARVNERWPGVDWEARHRQVLTGGEPHEFITPAQTTAGRLLWVRDTVVPIGPDTVLAVAEDCTMVVQYLVRVALT